VAQASARARGAATREQQESEGTARSAPRPMDEYVSHIVRRGETLTGLARRYRTSPDVLRQLNRLGQDDITVGQRLRVPKPAPGDTSTR
jgi:LysM repeat protein